MAIDFPSSPSVNDTFTVGDTIYKWDGTVWTSTVSGAADFLPVTGGTVTGTVTATGGFVGDLTGAADQVEVADAGFDSLNNRPIACFGTSVNASDNTDPSAIKWAQTNHPYVNGDGSINAPGGFVGDVTGRASTVAIADATFGTTSWRPIACWGSASDGGGVTESEIKVPIDGPDTARVRGDGRILGTSFSTGGVVIGSSTISSGLGESIAALGNAVVGKYVLAGKKQDTGEKTLGNTLSGSNLRAGNCGGTNAGSGTLSGTWRCQGYSGNNTGSNYTENSTTVWIRIS